MEQFHIITEVTKATKISKNTLLIEGIASDANTDRDAERFTKDAVAQMMTAVIKGEIPVRVEHENKFFTDIGIWKTATLKNGKLHVKGEVDTRLSLGSDLEIMLEKGAKIGLSVGGLIYDVVTEFSNSLNKNIRVFKDIALREISIVANPSNYSAENLSVAKSKKGFVDYKSIEKDYENMIKLSSEEFIKKTGGSAYLGLGITSAPTTVKSSLDEGLTNVFKKEMNNEIGRGVNRDEAVKKELSSRDFKTVVALFDVMRSIDINSVAVPADLTGETSWEMISDLGDECFVPDTYREFPHHNKDFSVNIEWVKYWLCMIVKGKFSWLTAKQLNNSITHLYHHLKESYVVKKSIESTEKAGLTAEALELMKTCHTFKVNHSGNRPQVDGNDLSDKEVNKLANAFVILVSRNKTTVGARIQESVITEKQSLTKSIMNTENKVTAASIDTATEVVKTSPVGEVTVSTPVTTTSVAKSTDVVIEESTEIIEEVKTDAVEDVVCTTEDTGIDASKNNTSTETTTTEAVEPKAEEVIGKTEDTPKETLAVSPTVPAIDETIVKSIVGDAIAPLTKMIESLQLSIEAQASFTKSANTEAESELEAIKKSQTTQATLLEKMSNSFASRKSVAAFQPMTKVFTEGNVSQTDSVTKRAETLMDSGMSMGEARATARKEANEA